jgi:hypothetical protein
MTGAAAIDALKHDATIWDAMSRLTVRTGQEASARTLGESRLSRASVPSGLLATDEEIQRKVATPLGEAGDVTRG